MLTTHLSTSIDYVIKSGRMAPFVNMPSMSRFACVTIKLMLSFSVTLKMVPYTVLKKMVCGETNQGYCSLRGWVTLATTH